MASTKGELPALVQAYIASTRFSLEAFIGAPLEAAMSKIVYAAMSEFVARQAARFGIEAPVSIIYTDMMRSEAITVNGKSLIVHDQYFGQAINMMNRLLLYGASRETKFIYFHKVASLILSRYGFYEEAVHAANFYRRSRHRMDHKRKQGDEITHAIYTSLQEHFVVLHELAHVAYKSDRAALIRDCSRVSEWLKVHAQQKMQGLTPNHVDTSALTNDEKIEFLSRQVDFEKSMAVQADILTSMLSRTDLLEEFCCDEWALLRLVEAMDAGEWSMGQLLRDDSAVEDKIFSLLLCLMNLRALQLMEATCASTPLDFASRDEQIDLDEGLPLVLHSARLHRAKELCYGWLTAEDQQPGIHARVVRLMDQHNDEILGPALSTMNQLLFEASLRKEIETTWSAVDPKHLDDPHFKRTVSTILHIVGIDENRRPAKTQTAYLARAKKRKKLKRLSATSRRKNRSSKP